MKKITLCIMTFAMLFTLCACADTKEKTQNDTQDNTQESTQAEQKITISSIQISPDDKAIYAEILIPDTTSSEGTNYWLDGVESYRTDAKDTEEGLQLDIIGFYADDSAWKTPKLYKGFQSADNSNTPLGQVTIEGKALELEHREIEAQADGARTTVPVDITPYTVSICPAEKWREDGCFYNVIAVTKDGERYSMGYLPLTDDRKASEKKNHPLEDTTGLEMLGDGFSSASETDNDGVRYAFNRKVDIDEIEKIELEKIEFLNQ